MTRRHPQHQSVPLERRHPDDDGRVVLMAWAAGYVMVRRPGREPFVVGVQEWANWPTPRVEP